MIFKYYEKIKSAQKITRSLPSAPLEKFSLETDAGNSLGGRLISAILSPFTFSILRKFVPILRIGPLVVVSRDKDVRDVLNDPEHFEVPFGLEMAELAGGDGFVLGMEDAPHDRQHEFIQAAIGKGDSANKDLAMIANLSQRFSKALLENSAGRIDVMKDLMTRVASEVCFRYFGFTPENADDFADWTFAASKLLFADPTGNKETRLKALNAAARIRLEIDDAIDRSHRNPGSRDGDVQPTTLLDRLVKLQEDGNGPSDGEIRAILFGLSVGFIPTNTLASGKILEELLQRPKAWKEAMTLAQSGDKEGLKKYLLEAGRLNPALSPGQWRYCRKATTIGTGWLSKKQVKTGTVILVATMSALRDRRVLSKPRDFLPDRTYKNGKKLQPDLLFGDGAHECLGKYLAIEQITETFMVLLAQPNLRTAKGRSGKMQFASPFPRRLDMEFDTPNSEQSMFLVVAPVTRGISKKQLDGEIAQLGYPAKAPIRGKLDHTEVVHFASLATVQADDTLYLIFEVSADGSTESALDSIATKAAEELAVIFQHAGFNQGEDLAGFLISHVVELHGKPWGATGLNFNGTDEFSVKRIEKQESYARLVENILRDHLGRYAQQGSRPKRALTHVRRILSQDPYHALWSDARKGHMDEAKSEEFDAYRLVPSRAKLRVADFENVSKKRAALNFSSAKESRIIKLPLAIVLASLFWGFFKIIEPAALLAGSCGPVVVPTIDGLCRFSSNPLGQIVWDWIQIITASFGSWLLIVGLLLGGVVLYLRKKEKNDAEDLQQAPLEHIEALCRMEDSPGHAQNHIMAVGTLKSGPFRKFIHALALWAIRMIIIFYYRPGFVTNMGTIHYARWWRLPGTNKSIFYSNYDGSWESYLEDFITRARWGQTAAWSNWQGFPKTEFLIFEGAKDGDRFKQWVRRKQQVVPFWYNRFQHLTTDQIRKNALIHHGLARAETDTEARDWLRSFGSMPRVEDQIETDEIQTLVFRGLKNLRYSKCHIIKLPREPDQLHSWQNLLNGHRSSMPKDQKSWPDLEKFGGLNFYDHDRLRLNPALSIAFGDHSIVGEAVEQKYSEFKNTEERFVRQAADLHKYAVFLAFSAEGLSKFHSGPEDMAGDLPSAFPPAFKMGMAKRSRQLGDIGTSFPSSGRWKDSAIGSDQQDATVTAEAALFVYASDPEGLEEASAIHKELLKAYGGSEIQSIDCAPADPLADDIEHFGFRDGISQPVIRGSKKFLRNVPERDIVEPGEIILGYKNNQGYFPPSPLVRPEADLRGTLPAPAQEDLSRFPNYGEFEANSEPRDFGRNGSFLVIRELEQDVDGFEDFIQSKADEINRKYYSLHRTLGQRVNADWVAAKMMGRWRNGRPLVGNPIDSKLKQTNISPAVARRAERQNDFSYGIDDPQGFACPFAAHIRRANPRDSKQPGDENEQIITNRHRILRRGRTYLRPQDSDKGASPEKGLLFVGLCGDIERQFEFVQQTWMNSPFFHGLANEPDPIAGNTVPDSKFTIPTPAGPITIGGIKDYVAVKGGGYFFLPSRASLSFLVQAAKR